jgi:hypothetical protein
MMSDHHRAHGPYLAAVADALHDHGVSVDECEVEPNDPRDGWIVLGKSATPLFGDREVVLAWTEERGWYRGVRDERGTLTDVRSADLDVVPAPELVVSWARAVVTGTDLRSDLGYYRHAGDADDFEDELHTYDPAPI